MSDPMPTIYRTLGGPWALAADIADLPTRTVTAQLACRHTEPVEHSLTEAPCGWEGTAVVAVFTDTQEALWLCPDGHENSERYGDYA